MEIQEIVTAISTVGFPIAMCLLQFYQNNAIISKVTEAINENAKTNVELAETIRNLKGE